MTNNNNKWRIYGATTVAILIFLFLGYKYFCNIDFEDDAITKFKILLPNYLFIAILIERFVQGIFLRKENGKINALKTKIRFYNKNIELRNQLLSANVNIGDPRLFDTNTTEREILKTKGEELSKEESIQSEKFSIHALIIGFILAVVGFRFFQTILQEGCCKSSQMAILVFDIFFTSILFAGGSQLIKELLNLVNGFKISKS